MQITGSPEMLGTDLIQSQQSIIGQLHSKPAASPRAAPGHVHCESSGMAKQPIFRKKIPSAVFREYSVCTGKGKTWLLVERTKNFSHLHKVLWLTSQQYLLFCSFKNLSSLVSNHKDLILITFENPEGQSTAWFIALDSRMAQLICP